MIVRQAVISDGQPVGPVGVRFLHSDISAFALSGIIPRQAGALGKLFGS